MRFPVFLFFLFSPQDLSCLNRDLSKVIFLDWNPQSFKLQPRNTFKLKKWSGEDGDTTLYDLGNFLKSKIKSVCNLLHTGSKEQDVALW